jgi:hypothetical protein
LLFSFNLFGLILLEILHHQYGKVDDYLRTNEREVELSKKTAYFDYFGDHLKSCSSLPLVRVG